MYLNTIKQKLLLLLTLSIGSSMLLAGISLSIITKNNYERSTKDSFDNYYERTANTFQQINKESLFYANELAHRDTVTNALNLISEYADIDNYQSIIFDTEKKNIARTLLNYTKSTRLQEASVYDNKGWLVAFAQPNNSLMGFVSFENSKPVIFISKDIEGKQWIHKKNDNLIVKTKIKYDLSKRKSLYVYDDNNVGIEAVSTISRQLPDGTDKNIGQLFLTNPINDSVLNSLSKGSLGRHSILLPNGKSVGDEVSGLTITNPLLVPELFNHRKTIEHKWLESTRFFTKAYSIPVEHNKHIYLISSLDRSIINEQINSTILIGLIVFAISALILLPLGLLFARYSITSPIDKLVNTAKSIEEGKYVIHDIDNSSSIELNTLANALNAAAKNVMSRENELHSQQDLLEKRVDERTKDLSVTNKKLEQENKVRLVAEKKLGESTKMLQLVMDSIPQFIFWKDINSTYLGCNQNFLKTIGHNNIENLIGKTDYDMPWAKEEADMYRADDRMVMDTDTAKYNIYETSQTADGTTIHIETNKVPLHDKDGNVMGILCAYTDITDRKRVEAVLAESEEKFRRIVELSPFGIILNTLDNGSFIDVNPAFLHFTGYSEEEIKSLSYWDLTPDEYEEQEKEQLNLLNSTGHYGPYEKEYIHKNGHRFHVLLEGLLMNNLSGEPYIFSMIQDITDRKDFENELIAAKNVAEKANMAKSEFLSSMSHELRTPLNAILGFAQLIELDTSKNPDGKASMNIKEILTAGYHLLDLINEVLDLARIESNELKMDIEYIETTDIMNHCIKLTSQLAESKNILLIDETENCEQNSVFADSTRFKQILINLISNAIKYNRENGKVTIRCNNDDSSFLHFDIIDTGIGIQKNKIGKLFKSFERLGAEKSGIDGTGIGLVITKKLVEHMGGSIGVESKEDKGSRFWFTLPYTTSSKT